MSETTTKEILEAIETARAEGAMWLTGGYHSYSTERGDELLKLCRILSGIIIQGRAQHFGELYARWVRGEILSDGTAVKP